MAINPLSSQHIDPAKLSLDQLAASKQVSEKDKIGEASRAFEAVLLRQILQESQKPVFKSKYTSDSAADGIYRDTVVNQLAESISKSGSLGLGKSLARELQRHTGTEKPSAAAQPEAAKPHLTPPKHE